MQPSARHDHSSLEIADNGVLSPREDEVNYWSALGKSNDEIALILGISPETVKAHLKNIFSKLHVYNRPSLVTESFRRGILRFGTVLLALCAQYAVELSDEDGMRARFGRRTREVRTIRTVRTTRSRTEQLLALFEDYA